ncbi:hypothetical protein EV144_107250 [Flavobacterium sp. 270]|uniref:hypothetical protein n=1 Tax=Flavobacterium sp. 270 TaxID=2512114 RepID=UPI001064D3A2|nr:hypothetical protein [Flavobacterium sp. 270]TDW46056.1 hypothetical protein EV144_107250 [Flavobacterium sp. 270]
MTLDLNRISIDSYSSLTPQDLTNARTQNQILEDRLGSAKVGRFLEDTRLRRYLTYIFSFIIFLWLASVISILYFNHNLLNLNLSDSVLITLLTTTSINVIGMMLIILKNLFPQPKVLE